jgi:predicted Fe-Mo cluster-binding NifX family protein
LKAVKERLEVFEIRQSNVEDDQKGGISRHMKIAVPVWEGKVSPVFDSASRLLILQVENNRETLRSERDMDERDLARRCSRIKRLDVDTLICGAISRYFYRMLVAADIEVIPWISGPVEEVLEAYMHDTLHHSKFLMPGNNWHEDVVKDKKTEI